MDISSSGFWQHSTLHIAERATLERATSAPSGRVGWRAPMPHRRSHALRTIFCWLLLPLATCDNGAVLGEAKIKCTCQDIDFTWSTAARGRQSALGQKLTLPVLPRVFLSRSSSYSLTSLRKASSFDLPRSRWQ